jgi:hypothetical protein
VRRQVDEFFGQRQRYVQRVRSAAADQARKRGYDAAKTEKHISGAAGQATKAMDARFTQLFGDHEPAVKRYARHKQIGRSPAPYAVALRQTRGAFTRAVLPVSTKWLSGQAIEAAIRSVVMGAGPVSHLRGARLARELRQTPEGKHALERMLPGGLVSRTGAGEITRKTLAEDFAPQAGKLAEVAQSVTEFGRKPGIRQLRAAHDRFTRLSFDTINGRIERFAQQGMLGRAIKESPLMERRVIGLSDKAIKDAAAGVKGSDAQIALAREVQKAYGKYSNYGPELRNAVIYWTPFLPWMLNVGRFLTATLPRDHPMHAAMVASLDAATEDWRKAHHLSLKGSHVPPYLLGAYPKGEGFVRWGHYMPFGAEMTDVTGSLADLLLPQFAGVYRAAHGEDWKGDPLKGHKADDADAGTRTKAGVDELLGAFLPYYGATQGAIQRGAKRQFLPWQATKGPPRKPLRKRKVKRLPLAGFPGALEGKPSLPGF